MGKKIWFWVFALLVLGGGASQAATMVSVTADSINMYAGPGDNFPVLWSLGVGFPLRALEEQGDWYRVEDFEGAAGWVRKKLVGREAHVIVKGEKANIRSGPSDRYKLLGVANRGVVLQTLKVKGNWVKVKHAGGVTGWVSLNLLWGL
jgi:SH3-like domain-containing protein